MGGMAQSLVCLRIQVRVHYPWTPLCRAEDSRLLQKIWGPAVAPTGGFGCTFESCSAFVRYNIQRADGSCEKLLWIQLNWAVVWAIGTGAKRLRGTGCSLLRLEQ